jgi:predicted metal-dependent hydrolase
MGVRHFARATGGHVPPTGCSSVHNRLKDTVSWADVVSHEIKLWLKQRARRDVHEVVAHYRKRFDLTPRALRVAEFAQGWGSCSPTGTINIDWRLVFAPKRVLEYVVVHELAHLKHRSHGDAFWTYLASILPDYERPEGWLNQHQGSLDAQFLSLK